jgi:hypothetical protein
MGRLREELVEPGQRTSRDRRRYVLRGITQVDWVYLGGSAGAQQARRQGQNTAAVGRRALGEHADDAVRVCVGELLQRHQLRLIGGEDLWSRKGETDGAEERDALDLARRRVRACEDGLENASKIERIEWGCEGACDDGARLWQVIFGRVKLSAAMLAHVLPLFFSAGHVPSLHTVNLQIYPPHARHCQQQPQHRIPDRVPHRQQVQDAKVQDGQKQDARGPDDE